MLSSKLQQFNHRTTSQGNTQQSQPPLTCIPRTQTAGNETFAHRLARTTGRSKRVFHCDNTAITRRSPADLAIPPLACLCTKCTGYVRGELHVRSQEWRALRLHCTASRLANDYGDRGRRYLTLHVSSFQNPSCLSMSISHTSLPLTHGKRAMQCSFPTSFVQYAKRTAQHYSTAKNLPACHMTTLLHSTQASRKTQCPTTYVVLYVTRGQPPTVTGENNKKMSTEVLVSMVQNTYEANLLPTSSARCFIPP